MSNKKSRVQVLCVAMNQEDLSLAKKMNISSDVIIANQADRNEVIENSYAWGTVKMISTGTKGVGRNRNTAFMYADGEILLLSDDDMRYSDTYAEDIVNEFDAHPDADVFIFNIISTDAKRAQKQNCRTMKMTRFSRLPYGAPRIAVRRSSWEKSNVWFTTLFGGGAKYTNGEDSMFLADLRKKGLVIYVSNKCIGQVNMNNSTWFHGVDAEFYFNKGAFSRAVYPRTRYLRMIYFLFGLESSLGYGERLGWFKAGMNGYESGTRYREVIEQRS